jgi:hypothetical protein
MVAVSSLMVVPVTALKESAAASARFAPKCLDPEQVGVAGGFFSRQQLCRLVCIPRVGRRTRRDHRRTCARCSAPPLCRRRAAVWGHRVDADRVDHPIDADAVGELANDLDWVLPSEVDDLSARCRRHSEPIFEAAHCQNPVGAEQFGAEDGELAGRAASEDRDCVAIGDLGYFSSEIAGRKDIGNQDRLLVRDLLGSFTKPTLAKGILRLQSIERGRSSPGRRKRRYPLAARIVPGFIPVNVPRTMCRSVSQMALVMRMTASVGCSIRGVGTPSSLMSPTPGKHRLS